MVENIRPRWERGKRQRKYKNCSIGLKIVRSYQFKNYLESFDKKPDGDGDNLSFLLTSCSLAKFIGLASNYRKHLEMLWTWQLCRIL